MEGLIRAAQLEARTVLLNLPPEVADDLADWQEWRL